MERLEQGIDAILTSENFAAYLRMMANLHQYSFGNVLLIYTQCPSASMVAGYRRWQELGRQVRRGEKGITILVPLKHHIKPEEVEDEREARWIIRGFGVGTVFDVAATDGPPVPQPPEVALIEGASDPGMRLYADLLDYLDEQGVPVSREHLPRGNGYFEPGTRRIGIGTHVDGDQATKTLAHETAHLVAGHTLGMDHREVETVAESAAFVVLTHFGIDSSGYSFAYIARWAQDRAVLKANLDAIQRVSHQIITGLEGGAPLLSDHDGTSSLPSEERDGDSIEATGGGGDGSAR
jgi:antirestriction protein ArdC